MARLIKMSYDAPGNMQKLLSSKVRATVERKLDAARKDFSEAVSGALQVGKVALKTNTPASVFPSAANPPERRRTGKMFSHFKRKDTKRSSKDGVYEAVIGWRSDDGYEEYFGYQEEGFWHRNADKFIRGVNALEYAKQEFDRDMSRRGY